MGIFISYILLGLSLAAPIGPVNAAQIDRGVRNGFLHSWLVGLGAVLADIIYMLIVYLGVAHVINTPFVKSFLWLFGCFILLYTGIESLTSSHKLGMSNERKKEPLSQSFLSGFLMSIANPLTIIFWLGIYGAVLAKTAASYGTKDLFIFSSAIIIGLLLWDITMATVSSGFRKWLKARTLSYIGVLSGIVLIGFGIYFGIQGVQEILHFSFIHLFSFPYA
ncbi:LysE family transporter [Salirhabdus salicampi]|uniref:LysE family transporter n=1 Tax=Salirhabdus salicampi TaxID=476102 RepID=UPI0020C1BA6E|nr:LysE family transporter [Salirhabdus salicampi]MCP8617299.1 LysE family translocator [Salirhabdus salicampi]